MPAGICFGVIRALLDHHCARLLSIASFIARRLYASAIIAGQRALTRVDDAPRPYTCIAPPLSLTIGDTSNYYHRVRNLLAGRDLPHAESSEEIAGDASSYSFLTLSSLHVVACVTSHIPCWHGEQAGSTIGVSKVMVRSVCSTHSFLTMPAPATYRPRSPMAPVATCGKEVCANV